MRDEHMVICSPAVFELVSPDSAPVPVKVELTYDSRDPYAVQASFRTGQVTAVDWVFARDLLADGLMASSGTGDVRVQPMPTDPTRIELELNSPSGHALFTTCAQTLTGGHHDGCNLRHASCSLVIMPLARSCRGGNALSAGVTPEMNRIFALQHLHGETNWLNYEHRKGAA